MRSAVAVVVVGETLDDADGLPDDGRPAAPDRAKNGGEAKKGDRDDRPKPDRWFVRPSWTMPLGWWPGSADTSVRSAAGAFAGTVGGVDVRGVYGEWTSAAGQRDGIAHDRPCVPRTRLVMYLRSVDNPI